VKNKRFFEKDKINLIQKMEIELSKKERVKAINDAGQRTTIAMMRGAKSMKELLIDIL